MSGAFRLGVVASAIRSGVGPGPEPGGNFPEWLSATPSEMAIRGTSHTVAMPATVSAGDLLLLLAAFPESNRQIGTPSGWTAMGAAVNNVFANSAVFYKIASGSEGGTTITVPYVNNCRGVYQVHRFSAGTFNTSSPIARAVPGTGSSQPTLFPALAPPWGLAKATWIAFFSANKGVPEGVTPSFPYPDGQMLTQNSAFSSGSEFIAMHSSRAEKEAASETPPSTSTTGTGDNWIGETLAVRPAP